MTRKRQHEACVAWQPWEVASDGVTVRCSGCGAVMARCKTNANAAMIAHLPTLRQQAEGARRIIGAASEILSEALNPE